MKKRIATVLLVFVLIVGVLPFAALASGGLGNFIKVNTYQSGYFTDVTSSKWYTPYVQTAYEYGLIDGATPSTYAPGDNLTLGQAVKLAATLHSIYATGSAQFKASEPWYRTYADYALKNGIIPADYPDYDALATRADFAQLLAGALPAEALAVKNNVEDNAVPDVPLGFSYAPAVYELYRAGVLVGSDAKGYFLPNNDITRAEAAAIVTRMVNASFRKSITLRLDLTTAQIFEKCAPSVFFIKIFDIRGTAIKTGSGFFINEDGLAVTNFHVINGAASATITTADGKDYNVAGVYDYSKEKDLALIKVDGGNFPYLQTADSDTVITGDSVYAIGSPLGFKNTISTGLISYFSRDVEGKTFIQMTAPISSGSSGGALLDSSGRVIGVTTATASGGQNVNLALPINMLEEFKTTTLVSLKSILPNTVYYDNHYPVPDFGVYAGVAFYQKDEFGTYYYRVSDLPKTIEDTLNGYAGLLEDNTFQNYGYAIENGNVITYYTNGAYGILMTLGNVDLDGTDCIRVQIMG